MEALLEMIDADRGDARVKRSRNFDRDLAATGMSRTTKRSLNERHRQVDGAMHNCVRHDSECRAALKPHHTP